MKNKKLIATIASLCLVVVALVAAVIGVLAAAQQNVAGNFRVTYTANDVSAVVQLDKKVDAQSPAYTGAPQSKTFLKSDTEVTAANATLTLAEETLSVSKKWVIYKFTFQNTNTANGMDILATYAAAGKNAQDQDVYSQENVDVYYAWGATEPSVTYGANEIASVTGGTALTAGHLGNGPQTAARVGAGDTITLFILVAIHDLNADAHYYLGGSDENTLTFALTRQGINPASV